MHGPKSEILDSEMGEKKAKSRILQPGPVKHDLA